MVDTRLQWWTELASRSATVARMAVPADSDYRDSATHQPINHAACNIGACLDHNDAIARWVDSLADRGAPIARIEKLLVDLTSRNTYGAFSELAGYGLLIEADIPFRMQVPLRGSSVLNPNGSDLDGALKISTPVYFDIKAFGLHEHLSNELTRRLSAHFPDGFVSVGGSADVGVDVLSDLLDAGFGSLATELKETRRARRDALEIRVEPSGRVQFVTNFANPYELAKNHADYAFRFAKQFVRRRPFMLMFVIHPWLGGFRLSTNFKNDAETFMRSFARRAFMQFRSDRSKLLGVTRAAASRLLSGIMFVDAWQKPSGKPRQHALFLNPYARNPVPGLSRDRLATSIRDIHFDDFAHDAY